MALDLQNVVLQQNCEQNQQKGNIFFFSKPFNCFSATRNHKKGFANIAVVFNSKSCTVVSPRQPKCTIWVNQLSFSDLDINIATQQLSSLACFYKQTYWSILQIIEIAIFWDLTAIGEKSFLSTRGVIKNGYFTDQIHHLKPFLEGPNFHICLRIGLCGLPPPPPPPYGQPFLRLP